MLTSLLLTAHYWRRHVSPWRVAGAVLVLVVGDLLLGVVVASVLGAKQWGTHV